MTDARVAKALIRGAGHKYAIPDTARAALERGAPGVTVDHAAVS